MKRQSLAIASLCLVTVLVSGCSETYEKTEMVPVDKVPEAVMSVAHEKLPDVKFDTAWIENEGGEIFYEVRGKSGDGKTRDIKVSPDGKVLEID